MKIELATNEAYNVDLRSIEEKLPNYAVKISNMVLLATSFDKELKELLEMKLHGIKGKVLKFIIMCLVRHRNLIWGMVNSFLYCESKLDGFMYLKHNFEYVAVISAVINEIKLEMTEGSWKKIEKDYLYNVKSIFQYCKDFNKENHAKKFEKIGKQTSIMAYLKKMPDEYQQHYAITNALSHPNNYTTMSDDFPYIQVEPVDYLIEQSNYLQKIVKERVDFLLKRLRNNIKL